MTKKPHPSHFLMFLPIALITFACAAQERVLEEPAGPPTSTTPAAAQVDASSGDASLVDASLVDASSGDASLVDDRWSAVIRAPATSAEGIVWQPFSEELMTAARTAERPVFLQYAADWCKPCKVHERKYFSKPDIRQKFMDSGVLPVKADLSTPNDRLEERLLELTRLSLPTYAVYYPDGSTDVLPMQLTRRSLEAALDRARAR